MKTELDFTKVPLDKWVDLFNACKDNIRGMSKLEISTWQDVKKAAEVQVKDENDLNKEIVEAYTAWILSGYKDIDHYDAVQNAFDARKKLLGIQDKPVEQKPELLPVDEVIK